jgi:transcriptional regulator with XRE-family HTH domain
MAKTDPVLARAELRSLGRQIRLLRERRSLSLNDLARQSGISVTGIRNIELGRANPGLLTIVAIIDVLGVPIDELVAMIRRANKTVYVSRAPGGRQQVQRSLSEVYDPRIRGRVLTLPAGTDMVAAPRSETGPHFAFVLDGTIELALKDGTAHRLATGDAVHFADEPPRVLANRGRRPARVLWVKNNHRDRDRDRADAAHGPGR